MTQSSDNASTNRRDFLRGAAVTCVAGLGGYLAANSRGEDLVWQIDPLKCITCELCAERCVLKPSAAKAVHTYAMCGYCRLCSGYFVADAPELVEAAENAQCPTDAIRRTFIEDPYFEYTIDEDLCIGCARCVKGCGDFGNASLYMQVRHDRCVNCNECAIAKVCPADAFVRVPASQPYLLKGTTPPPDGAATDAERPR